LWRAVRGGWEIAAAIACMVVIEAGLRLSPLPTTCRRLGIRMQLDGAAAPDTTASLPASTRLPVRAALAVTQRWPAGDTCLRRCLLIGHRLRHLDPILRIGVRRDAEGAFGAHAWLEIGGQTLDPGTAGFAVLRSSEQ
jgi:hypothetical protein